MVEGRSKRFVVHQVASTVSSRFNIKRIATFFTNGPNTRITEEAKSLHYHLCLSVPQVISCGGTPRQWRLQLYTQTLPVHYIYNEPAMAGNPHWMHSLPHTQRYCDRIFKKKWPPTFACRLHFEAWRRNCRRRSRNHICWNTWQWHRSRPWL